MWDEGIEMAKTAYALDEALESGDTGRIIELSELLSQQVKNEVSSRAEAEGWYEEYDRATSAEGWQVETVVDPFGPAAFPRKVVPVEREAVPDRALQRLRREAGFRSTADFAKASGLPVGKYTRYERGPVDDIPADAAAIIAKQLAASGVQVPSWLSERADKVSFDRDLIEKGLEQGLIQVEPVDDVDIRVSIGENWFWAKMPEELGSHASRHFSDISATDFTDAIASALMDLADDPDVYADELVYYDVYLRENVDLPEEVSSSTTNVPTVSFDESFLGEHYTLALYSERYSYGDGMAVGLIDVGKDSEDFGEEWSVLTVNLPDDPVAVSWCAQEGHVVIDTNDNSKELVDALVGAGLIELSGETVRSGFCSYPLATLSPQVMCAISGYEQTVERVLASRQEADVPSDHGQDRDSGVSLKDEAEAMRESATQLGGGDAPSKPDPQR